MSHVVHFTSLTTFFNSQNIILGRDYANINIHKSKRFMNINDFDCSYMKIFILNLQEEYQQCKRKSGETDVMAGGEMFDTVCHVLKETICCLEASRLKYFHFCVKSCIKL